MANQSMNKNKERVPVREACSALRVVVFREIILMSAGTFSPTRISTISPGSNSLAGKAAICICNRIKIEIAITITIRIQQSLLTYFKACVAILSEAKFAGKLRVKHLRCSHNQELNCCAAQSFF